MKTSLASATLFSALLFAASVARADAAANFVCEDGKGFTVIFEKAGRY